MKCKVCNHELISGSRQCPHCGAAVPDDRETFVSEFKWNIQDYPKPKKHQEPHISIDWKSGRILDEDSGKIYDQSLNEWAEPEEIRDLFTFDTKNERRQQTLDREMDRIFRGTAKPSPAQSNPSSDRKPADGGSFRLPPSMKSEDPEDMPQAHRDLLAGLFRDNPFGKDNPFDPFDEKDDDLSGPGESPQNDTSLPQEESAGNRSQKIESAPEKPVRRPAEEKKSPGDSDNLVDDFIRALHNISGDIYGSHDRKHSSPQEEASVGKTSPAPASPDDGDARQPAASGQDLPADDIGAPEEKTAPETPQTAPYTFSFLKESELQTDEDASSQTLAAAAENSAEPPADDGDGSFSGFSRLIEAEKRFKDDMEKVTFLTPAEYEEAEKAEKKSQKLRFVPTISFRTIEDEYEAYRRDSSAARQSSDEEKGVEISINEPSGTKVTVKTQEISLASLNDDTKIKTREVRLDDVRQTPKNVQVSVEVNAARGNASVEVTRRHDGATVVKTVDKSDSGHVYVDGEDRTDYSIPSDDSPETAAASPAKQPEEAGSPEENVSGAIQSGILRELPEEVPVYGADDPVLDDLDEKLMSDDDGQEIQPEAQEPQAAETPDICDSIPEEEKKTETENENTGSAEDGRPEASEKAADRTSSVTPDAVADGSASSEAAQQTMQIPALEAKELAAALAGRKAAQQANRQLFENAGEAGEEETPAEFWEKPSGVSKMTITDIFGPDARRIMEEGRKNPDGGQTEASLPTADPETKEKNDSADSGILSIQPEDIAPSPSQTESIYIPSADSGTDRRGVTTDTISRERQAEMKEALDAIDSIKEAERREKEKAEKKARKERLKAERSRLKAEKKEAKKAARDSAKAKAAEASASESADPDRESERLSSTAKILIIVLSVLLVIEFAIIGIKLFAPDSGAATLIHRVETQVTGIFGADSSQISAVSESSGISAASGAADISADMP